MIKSIGKFLGKFFVGDKGIIEQVSDVADKWNPSETTRHKMSLEDQKAGDASQESARNMKFISHDSWLDILVDAGNRMPRLIMGNWAAGVLIGLWKPPEYLSTLDQFTGNVLWTIITFFFGARFFCKDVPNAVFSVIKRLKK